MDNLDKKHYYSRSEYSSLKNGESDSLPTFGEILEVSPKHVQIDKTRNNSYFKPTLYNRTKSSIISLNNKIYIVGGKNGKTFLASCEKYDPITGNWSQIAPLNIPRSNILLTVNEEKIYAISGDQENKKFNVCEVYCHVENTWKVLGSLNRPRLAAAAVSYFGSVWVLGGSYNLEIYDQIEVLDLESKLDLDSETWKTCPIKLNRKRCRHCAIVYNEKLFIIGGYDGKSFLDNFEVFNQTTKQFTEIIKITLKVPRSRLSCCISSNRIYIFGGFDHKGNALKSSEFYEEGVDLGRGVGGGFLSGASGEGWVSGPELQLSRGYMSVASLYVSN